MYKIKISTTGRSLVPTELIRSLPIPGSANTCYTTILPAKISAIIMPRNVMTGIMAFFKTWPNMT